MRILDFARSNRLPFTWHDEAPADGAAPAVRLPGGAELRAPSTGQVSRALGIGRELAPREEVDLLVVGGGPAGLGAAVYGASEGLETLVIESTAPRRAGRRVAPDRRLPWLPRRHHRPELTSRAVIQARKFGARSATPYRAVALEPGTGATSAPRGGPRDRRARRAPRHRRGSTGACRSTTSPTTRDSASSTPQGLLRRSSAARRASPSSAEVTRPAKPRCGSRVVALATLLHRRADLRETMSDYLVRELDRYGVAVRDRSEIAALHGENGHLAALTLRSGERVPFSFLFLFLGARPCTEWLGDTVARDENGFILTGADAHAAHLLETSVGVLRGRRRALRLDQAMCHGRGRGRDGRAAGPHASRPHADAIGLRPSDR